MPTNWKKLLRSEPVYFVDMHPSDILIGDDMSLKGWMEFLERTVIDSLKIKPEDICFLGLKTVEE